MTGRGKPTVPRATLRQRMGSCFGTLFRITTFGESHGPAIGVVVDGCPPRLPIALEDIQRELDRRRPGQSRLVSQRKETDRVEILSGVLDGMTLGTPIAMMIRNQDARSTSGNACCCPERGGHSSVNKLLRTVAGSPSPSVAQA